MAENNGELHLTPDPFRKGHYSIHDGSGQEGPQFETSTKQVASEAAAAKTQDPLVAEAIRASRDLHPHKHVEKMWPRCASVTGRKAKKVAKLINRATLAAEAGSQAHSRHAKAKQAVRDAPTARAERRAERELLKTGDLQSKAAKRYQRTVGALDRLLPHH